MRSSASSGDVEPARHARQIALEGEVAPRLVRRPHPLERAEVVVGRGGRYGEWHSTRFTNQKNGFVARLAPATARAPPRPRRRRRRRRAAGRRAPSAQAAAQVVALAARPGAARCSTSSKSSKPVAKPPPRETQRFVLTARGRVAGPAQHLGQQRGRARASSTGRAPCGEPPGRLAQAERARQQAGEHRGVRGQRPAGRRVDVVERARPRRRAAATRRRCPGAAPVGLERVGARGVEDQEEHVRRHQRRV